MAGESPVTVTSCEEEPTDASLVERMAAGDRDAFAAIFRRHRATVFRFCRQMLGTREAAEDVTQDVFIALAEDAARYQPGRGSLSTYLYGIARNLTLQRHRRARARAEIDVAELADRDCQALSVRADHADALSQRELIDRLRRAILRLPMHYREVIVLCELNGVSYEDAAAVVGCPVGTIRSRLNRARRMLMQRCRLQMGAEPSTEVWKPCLTPTKNGC